MKKLLALSILSLCLCTVKAQSLPATGGNKMMTTQTQGTNAAQKPARLNSGTSAIPATSNKMTVTNAKPQSGSKTPLGDKRLVAGTNKQAGDNHPKMNAKKAKQLQAAKVAWINQQKEQGKTNTGLRPVKQGSSSVIDVKK